MKNVNNEFLAIQKTRYENGKVVTYSDGAEYLISPSFSPVNFSVFKSHCKVYGWNVK